MRGDPKKKGWQTILGATQRGRVMDMDMDMVMVMVMVMAHSPAVTPDLIWRLCFYGVVCGLMPWLGVRPTDPQVKPEGDRVRT
jgi:hypothetical protein